MDLSALVRGMGIDLAEADTPEAFGRAFDDAARAPGPAVIRVPLDPAAQLALQGDMVAAADRALREAGLA